MVQRKLLQATVVLLTFILALFSASGSAQQMKTIRGKVVDRNNRGIANIPIRAKRGAETIAITNSKDGTDDEKGSYSLSFPADGTLEAVIYGNSEYGPNAVFNISGETNHDLTKVLPKNEKGAMLSVTEASEVLAALDYFRANPTVFAAEMMGYAGMIRKENFPEEFHLRLREFELAVAKLPKETSRNGMGVTPVKAGTGKGKPSATHTAAGKAAETSTVGKTEAKSIPSKAPIEISLGQTTEEVVAALGKAPRVVNLGSKKIYVYADLKITFVNGKVTNVE
jgi:hypothetical protein